MSLAANTPAFGLGERHFFRITTSEVPVACSKVLVASSPALFTKCGKPEAEWDKNRILASCCAIGLDFGPDFTAGFL